MKSLLSFCLCMLALAWTFPAEAMDQTLSAIRDGKVLKLGHRIASNPFSFVDEDGAVKGYTIDLCLAVAEAIKSGLEMDELEIVFVPTTAKNRLEKLESGETDIHCGAATQTIERQERFSFSLLIYVTGMEMLVHQDTGIGEIDDLSDKRIGVVEATTAESAVVKGLEKRGMTAEVVRFDDDEKALAALEAERIDVLFGDRIGLLNLSQRAQAPERLIMIDRFYSFEPYALVMPREALDLKLIADKTLSELYASRDIMEIFHRWFDEYGVASNETIMRALYKLQAIPP